MSKRSDRRRREHLQRLAAVALEAGQTAARQENATHQDACHLVDKLLAADPVLTHGGGPRTPEGKARSAQNSFRHGLAASFHRFQLLPGEDPREYTELCADLQSQFRPRTPAERHKLEDMAQAWWLQRRARNFQTAALADGDAECFALYLRYETSQRRGYQMAYKGFSGHAEGAAVGAIVARSETGGPRSLVPIGAALSVAATQSASSSTGNPGGPPRRLATLPPQPFTVISKSTTGSANRPIGVFVASSPVWLCFVHMRTVRIEIPGHRPRAAASNKAMASTD
jgi:hypothetical protein